MRQSTEAHAIFLDAIQIPMHILVMIRVVLAPAATINSIDLVEVVRRHQ